MWVYRERTRLSMNLLEYPTSIMAVKWPGMGFEERIFKDGIAGLETLFLFTPAISPFPLQEKTSKVQIT